MIAIYEDVVLIAVSGNSQLEILMTHLAAAEGAHDRSNKVRAYPRPLLSLLRELRSNAIAHRLAIQRLTLGAVEEVTGA